MDHEELHQLIEQAASIFCGGRLTEESHKKFTELIESSVSGVAFPGYTSIELRITDITSDDDCKCTSEDELFLFGWFCFLWGKVQGADNEREA